MKTLKQRLIKLVFLTTIFQCSHLMVSAQSDSSFIGLWTLDAQPMVLMEPRVGGLKAGAEYVFAERWAFRTDFCLRFIPTRAALLMLSAGEKDALYGFQIQPSLKCYVGKKYQQKSKYAQRFMNSFEFKAGYARYYNDVESWFSLQDGQGNRYQKILGYTRRQNNFDLSLLFNSRVYFKKQFSNMGLEFFMGMGARVKSFKYTKFSSELDIESIAREDQQKNLNLNQDGIYPIFPMGFRLFYIME
jgi:hypothetical protein